MIDWRPEHSYGITMARAIELGEDAEYPRISAAVFHFDELTPSEQRTVIEYKKVELAEAFAERKRIYADAKVSAQISRDIHASDKGLNPFPYKKKQNKDTIEMLQASIANLSRRAGIPIEIESLESLPLTRSKKRSIPRKRMSGGTTYTSLRGIR